MGHSLICQQFALLISNTLKLVGIDDKHYNTHSFRIGAATLVACDPAAGKSGLEYTVFFFAESETPGIRAFGNFPCYSNELDTIWIVGP